MPDATLVAPSMSAGALIAAAVFVACGGAVQGFDTVGEGRGLTPLTIVRGLHVRDVRARLEKDLERTGWRESPERIPVFPIPLPPCFAALGPTTVPLLSPASPP